MTTASNQPMEIKHFDSTATALNALERVRDEYLDSALADPNNIDMFWVKRALHCHAAMKPLKKSLL